MAENIDLNTYPPGWECKFDRRTGKHYYINYITKMTTWDDPRVRYKAPQSQGSTHPYPLDYVAHQTGHGSPYHVYPYPSPVPLQHAFQPPPYPSTVLHSSYSPKALPKQIMQELGGHSHGSPLSGGSPILTRGLSFTPKGSPIPNRVYSLTNKPTDSPITLAADTDALVAKISSMFPTVSETHIKILLKKYYNREAVVISALQVEKHPISTPGPFSTPPAGVSRLQAAAAGVYAGIHLARCASPTPPYGSSPRASPPLRPHSGSSGTFVGSPRSATRPHSSPKMKLRYLKSVFPKAEETLILDMLAGAENNVQRASEKLLVMGYFKRETVPPRLSINQKESDTPKPSPPPITPPRLKSIEEKQALKCQLQKKYCSIPERVVSIALESVDWSEERAEQILSVVLQEDAVNKNAKEALAELDSMSESKKDTTSSTKIAALPALSPVQVTTAQLVELPSNGIASQPSNNLEKLNRRHKSKKEAAKASISSPSDTVPSYKSQYLTKIKGPNPLVLKGAQDQLLLVDYITWNGANPELKSGPTVNAKGSMKTKKDVNDDNLPKPRGTNKDHFKGPSGIAKGSIYQNINKPNNLPQMKVGGE